MSHQTVGNSSEFPFIKMAYNPNPFTPLQERFLSAVRKKIVEIRDPNKEVQDYKSFDFYLEHTKKFGTIPKIRFKPNSLAVKQEIMNEIDYEPIVKKAHWRARRNAAAKLFDSHWDNLMFRLVKAGQLGEKIDGRLGDRVDVLHAGILQLASRRRSDSGDGGQFQSCFDHTSHEQVAGVGYGRAAGVGHQGHRLALP